MRGRDPRAPDARALLAGLVALVDCSPPPAPASAAPVERSARRATLAADEWHTCARARDGGLRCWGTDPLDDRSGAPAAGLDWEPQVGVVVPGLGPVRDLDLGLRHSCAALETGALVCWGRIDGDIVEPNPNPTRPAAMAGLVDVVDVAVGARHGCAVTQAGGVSCWGANEDGQLGDGTQAPRPAPVDTGLTGIAAITANNDQTCALHRDGGVSCWGDLGGDDRLVRSRPFPVRWVDDAVEVSTGARTCVRHASDKVECWSWTVIEHESFTRPVEILGLTAPRQISAGGERGCALEADGGVKCWTWPPRDDADPLPAYPVPDVRGATEVAVGERHACARIGAPDAADGSIVCWGTNARGQLGDGLPRIADRPLRVAGIADVVEVSAGRERTCVRRRDGALRCWGEKIVATMHLPVRATQEGWSGTPAEVVTAGDAEEIDTTTTGVCARSGARVVCFDSSNLPEVLEDVRAVDMPPSHRFGCWASTAGRVVCHGSPGWRYCPDGPEDCESMRVVDGTRDIVQLSVAETHGCGLDERGAVWCWSAHRRDLGPQPTARVDGIDAAIGITTGRAHACAWSAAGALWCWGENARGELGDGTTEPRPAPLRVALAGPCVAASAGDGFTCAALADGRAQCWGVNASGQLGDGTRTARATPGDVVGLAGVDALSAGPAHTCARTRGGEVWCWGAGSSGQLGQGIEPELAAPVRVAGLE